jgi:hypothetical protein
MGVWEDACPGISHIIGSLVREAMLNFDHGTPNSKHRAAHPSGDTM